MNSDGTERDALVPASVPSREDVLSDANLVFHIMESIKDRDAGVAVRALTNWSTAVNRTVSAACEDNANAWRDLMNTHFKEWLEVTYVHHASGWPLLGQHIAASDEHPRTCVKLLFDVTRFHRLNPLKYYDHGGRNSGVLDHYERFKVHAHREYEEWKRLAEHHSVYWKVPFYRFADNKWAAYKTWEREVFMACYYVDLARREADKKRIPRWR